MEKYIYFRTLAPTAPWVQSGMGIIQRSVIVIYNVQTKILAAQIVEEGSFGSGFRKLGPPSLAQVDDPCSVFNFIGIEYKQGRLLDCDIEEGEGIDG